MTSSAVSSKELSQRSVAGVVVSLAPGFSELRFL
jgi:hypothetical protein